MSFGEALKGLISWNDQEKSLFSEESDPPLVQKFSNHRRLVIKGETINVRTFVMPHHKGHKLPALPVVMFVHGLGGQMNQFEALIEYFAHFSTVISLDLPGHGKSPVHPNWRVNETDFLVEILFNVLRASISDGDSVEVVLIGHSMGTVLCAKLAHRLKTRCIGLIAICPPAHIDPKLASSQSWLGVMPTLMMDFFRSFDRIGGINSHSVNRMVAPHANDEIRTKQLRWNLQVNTQGWIRTAYGFTPATAKEWSTIGCPIFLVGGEQDQVTPPDEHISQIMEWLSDNSADEEYFESTILTDCGHAVMIERPEYLCGIVGDFINQHVEKRLSLQWQLAFLAAQMDKWSLKNEAKWRRTQSVGDRVVGTPFRGMKTLRQDDPAHSPTALEQSYPDIEDIIDISRESPPYEPLSFRRVVYHKFPTVSKIPPTKKEVQEFVELVDSLLEQNPDKCIAVHCHYGFNRTGFFITSYMILKLGFSIKDAILAFQLSRKPGIKHPHFIDELYVRYDQ